MKNVNRAAYGLRAMEKGTPDYCVGDDHTNAVDTVANVLHAAAGDDLEAVRAICGSAMHHHACEVHPDAFEVGLG